MWPIIFIVSMMGFHLGSVLSQCPKDQIVKVGAMANFTFNVDANALIQIVHNDIALFVGKKGAITHLNPRITSSNKTFSVFINNVTMDDFGQYNTSIGMKTSCGTQLTITDAPITKIAPPRQPVSAFDGGMSHVKGTIIIKCKATSRTKPDNPQLPMVYSWFKNGMYWNLSKNGILNTTDIDLSYNDDVIHCVATDDPGCRSALQDLNSSSILETIKRDSRCEQVLGISNNFTIRMEYGPRNVNLLPRDDNVTVNIGEKLSVNCSSDCNPPCNIRWYKDDLVLSNHTQLNIQVLNISNAGEYECRVKNQHGTKHVSLKVKLLDGIPVDEDVASFADGITPVVVYILIPIIIIIVLLIIIVIVVYCKKKRIKSDTKSEKKDVVERNAEIPLVTYNRPPTNHPGHTNRENLIYADLQLACPHRNIVHSHSDDKVIYDKIDFSKMAPPLNLL